MRPIKFRAWLKPEWDFQWKMLQWTDMYWLTVEWEYKDWKVAVHRAISDQCYAFSDEIELMQFTWLLDKNGVEIYEGDIIEMKNTDNTLVGGRTYPVTFQKWTFWLDERARKWHEKHFCPFANDHWKMLYKIIWNIYENPDLLTK